jgi:PAS domain-containing protein
MRPPSQGPIAGVSGGLPTRRLLGGGSLTLFEVEVVPLFATGTQQALGATVTFNDVTAFAKLDEQHRLVERELETTNEELQSTNEELETINEELQSTNDELEAMNELQGERTGDLDRAHMFLEGILGSLGLGVVVLDADARIQLWNSSAAEFWGLRDHAVVGAHFLTLDIGSPWRRSSSRSPPRCHRNRTRASWWWRP